MWTSYFNGFFDIWENWVQSIIISIYGIVRGIIKCEKVFDGIFTFSSLFEIKMKVFLHRTWGENILYFWPITITYIVFFSKELNIWNKIKHLNLNIFRTRCCKHLIFQTQIIWSNRIHSLKYLRSATFGFKDIVIRKSEILISIQYKHM